MQLPQFQSDSTNMNQMQQKWASILNPVIANPITNPVILNGVSLKTGSNVINTTLGQKTQGWFITDINAAVTVYRSAPFNDLTLTLTSSGAAICNLVIY